MIGVEAEDDVERQDTYYSDDPDLECTYCGGEQVVEGKDPCWDEGELITCPNCHGSGLRKDMTFW